MIDYILIAYVHVSYIPKEIKNIPINNYESTFSMWYLYLECL